jgi:hypothetical protein
VWSDAGYECLDIQIKKTAELEAELEAERQRRWEGNEANSRELAESQAREAKLRKVLELAEVWRTKTLFAMRRDMYEAAIALPADDTALKESIKQAKREALLEAAEWFRRHGHLRWVTELRKMAEERK